MSDFRLMIGDVFEQLALLPDESVDTCITSPPYWGLRDYGYEGQIGLEPTLGEHLDVMVRVFAAVRRVLKPMGTLWINYGDCYATAPNGRSAADTKAAGNDDRTFRDKPFSTVGPIYAPLSEKRRAARGPRNRSLHDGRKKGGEPSAGQIHAGGLLKPKDLCMIPNRLAIALQDDGWWVRAENIWGKPNPMPDSSGRYRPSTAHEKVWLLTKSAKSYYDAQAVKMPVSGGTNLRAPKWKTYSGGRGESPIGGARVNLFADSDMPAPAPMKIRQNPKAAASNSGVRANESYQAATIGPVEDRYLRNCEPTLAPLDVWNIATAAYADAHFATFPPALVIPCILAGCPEGGTVLDPFGGAGTTALVAQTLKRNSILIEMSEEYAEQARRRVMNGNIGLGLPE